MPNIKNIAHAILIVSLFLSFPVRAGEDQITLQEVDTSRDGAVSPDEAKAYLERLNAEYALELQRQENERRQNDKAAAVRAKKLIFHPSDVNKDGVISPDEHAAYLKKIEQKPIPAEVQNKNLAIKEDEDKKVSEYVQKKYDRRMEEISAFDANKDGVLQVEELRKSTDTKFNSADTDKDGILSPEEVAASLEKFKTTKKETYTDAALRGQANRLKNRYENADTNNDGQVSKEEYDLYMTNRQQNFDRDGDGIISKKEYRTDGEKRPSSYRRPQKKKD